MKFRIGIKREVRVIAALLGVSALIAFSERRQEGLTCKNVVIEIGNTHDNYFLDESDVMSLITNTGTPIIGNNLNRINLRAIEGKLKSDRHILEAELFGDLKGNLIVNVELRRPVARIVRTAGPDAYIAEDGTIMYTSDKFSARVLLISGEYADQLADLEDISVAENGGTLLEMIHFISNDTFWKAQVAQLDINSTGKIFIYPQVTGQLVEFGTAEEYKVKLKKLRIFYKEILPQKGWTKYDRVNVEYQGQVIAE
jgi:cell division protein FtsQ